MAGIKRRRLSAEAWVALFERQQTCGLSVEAFCAREGVSASSFYRWRNLHRAESTPLALSDSARLQSPGGFVDLGTLDRGASRLSSSFRLLLQLGALRLQIERG